MSTKKSTKKFNTNSDECFLLGEVKLIYETRASIKEMKQVMDSRDCFEYFKALFPANQMALKEMAYAIALNRANKIIGWIKISEGGLSGTVIEILNIAQFAILSNCKTVILAHNHPSGKLIASEADEIITKKAVNALTMLDMVLLDHIILSGTDDEYYSFADEGKI
jgi:DNA repair protein RadC